ncbi:MAG: hypothetical protein JOZ54_16845 [Acidobacteria bacterium]|nr:hypothetical protein [Acidobacteriota bacterium]
MARTQWKSALVGLLLFSGTAFAQTPAQSQKPNLGTTWRVTQQVFNDTPYRLVKLSQVVTERTGWIGAEPESFIAPNGKNVYTIENSTPGHGLVMLVTYAAIDEKVGGAFKGMVIAASGIDCNDRTPVACIPTAFHRWEGVYCDSNAAVRGTWDDNAGDPENFWTGIHLTTAPRGACIGGVPKLPSSLNATQPPKTKDGTVWKVGVKFENQTPYTLHLRNVWNSEATVFSGWSGVQYPPAVFKPGEQASLAWGYANLEFLHGPSALVMYDARDAANKYVGSVVYEAAVDCTDITGIVCTGYKTWSKATGAAIPAHHLEGRAKSTEQSSDLTVRAAAMGGPK